LGGQKFLNFTLHCASTKGSTSVSTNSPYQPDTTPGDHTMQMGMKQQVLSPGVLDGRDTDLCPQPLRILVRPGRIARSQGGE
jgi:hypothetical protein